MHFPSCPADRYAVFANGKIALVGFFDSPFFIQVDKRGNPIPAAIQVVRHGIMRGIQNPFADMIVREKSLHPEIGFQEAVGIMLGSRVEKRKDRQIAFRVRGNDHVKVMAMIKAVPGGIPPDVTVRLGKVAVAVTVGNAFFCTVADTVSAFPGRGNNRSAVTGNGKGVRINQPVFDRLFQEFPVIDLKKGSIRLILNGKRGRFQLFE